MATVFNPIVYELISIPAAAEELSPPPSPANQTEPPPDPPPPTDPEPRLAAPGEVLQAWDNETRSPPEALETSQEVSLSDGPNITYYTAYGDFSLQRAAPYFVGVGLAREADIAQSAFSMLHGDVLLIPANGAVDEVTASRLRIRYDLHDSSETLGVLNLTYDFFSDRQKISVSFTMAKGLNESLFRVAWLTFTKYPVVETADPADAETYFEDVQPYYGSILETLHGTGTGPNVTIKSQKGDGAAVIVLDSSDAKTDWENSYAGTFSFGNMTGNATLVTYIPGRLVIDPAIIASSQPADATKYSYQRKTFFDGERYWTFWKGLRSGTDTILYASSGEGRSWTSALDDIPGMAQGMPYQFTVANYGKTVAILWVDSSKTKVRIQTGEVKSDWIKWDNRASQDLVTIANLARFVGATFTPQGELAFTYAAGSSLMPKVYLDRYLCTGDPALGNSACVTGNKLPAPVVVYVGSTGADALSALPVAFNGDLGIVAVPFADASSASSVRVFVHYPDGGSCTALTGETYDFAATELDEGLFSAAPSGQYVSLFYRDFESSSYKIRQYNVKADCSGGYDSKNDPVHVGSGGRKQFYLTAAAQSDGRSVHLFFTHDSNGAGGTELYHMRLVPEISKSAAESPAWVASHTNASHLAAAPFATVSVSLLHMLGTTIYYTTWLLPLAGEMPPGSPWTQKVGAPLLNELGGFVNPAVGILSSGQILLNLPNGQANTGVSILYRQPGLFDTSESLYGYYYPPAGYGQALYPTIGLDLPWMDVAEQGGQGITVLHLPLGQMYPIVWDGPGSVRWFNNTGGVRFTMKHDAILAKYTMTSASGVVTTFDGGGLVTRIDYDPSLQTYATFGYLSGKLDSISDSSGHLVKFFYSGSLIDRIQYGTAVSFRLIELNSLGVPAGCTGTASDSGTLEVVDPAGRRTRYYVCRYLLTKVTFATGGKIQYGYASYALNTQIWRGPDLYSLPVLQQDVYNESGTGLLTRQLRHYYHVQNGEITAFRANFYDKFAVLQGAKEYRYRAAQGLLSERTVDESGVSLWFDMETLEGSQMRDVSGNVNHGTITGALSANGRFGLARAFDGNDYIISTASPELEPRRVTVSARIYPTVTNLLMDIVDKSYPDTTGSGYVLAADSDGSIFFCVYDGDTTAVCADSTSLLSANTWYLVTGTYDGFAVRVYLDSTERYATPYSGGISYNDANRQLVIGANYDTTQRKFKGTIDTVRVYDRALNPDEIDSLYRHDTIQRRAEKSWYSGNGMPHLVETFAGGELEPSALRRDAADDWGNSFYLQDASGNESFMSYANTNQQYRFYAPGSLRKTSEGKLYSTGFDNYSSDWAVIAGSPTLTADIAKFRRYIPALKMDTASTGTHTVERTFGTAASPVLEMNVRSLDATNAVRVQLFKGSTVKTGVEFSGGIVKYQTSTGWADCLWPGTSTPVPYAADRWYRLTVYGWFVGSPQEYHVYLDGIGICTYKPVLNQGTLYVDRFQASMVGSFMTWFDDVIVAKSQTIAIAGLAPRQTVELWAEDGTERVWRSQVAAPGASAVLWSNLRFRLGSAMVRIYAANGLLDYESPHKEFVVGSEFTYVQPKVLSEKLLKVRHEVAFWSTGCGLIDESGDESAGACGGRTSLGGWSWRQDSPLAGSYVQATDFAHGAREFGYQDTNGVPTLVYFVQHLRIAANKAPQGIVLKFKDSGGVWREAFWGSAPSAGKNMGALPPLRDQWIQLLVKVGDVFPSPSSLYGRKYWISGGAAEWDVSAIATSGTYGQIGDLFTTGLPTDTTYYVRVSWANNDTEIGKVGSANGIVTVPLYPKVTAFPILAKVQISTGSGSSFKRVHETVRWIYGADELRFVGDSGFPDLAEGTSRYPSSSLHQVQVGSKTYQGDCTDAVLCYDMESVVEGSEIDMTLGGEGLVDLSLLDLSGKGNHGKPAQGSLTGITLSGIGNGASGLGVHFSGLSKVSVPSLAFPPTTSLTISAWVRPLTTGTIKGIVQLGTWNQGGSAALWIDTDNKFHFGRSSPDTQIASDGAASTISMSHVAGTWDGATLRLYVNGVQQLQTGAFTSPITATTADVGIVTSVPYYMNGFIDQVVVYGRGLTANELAGLYESRLPASRTAFLRPDASGFVTSEKIAYEGTYLYRRIDRDSMGNPVDVTDLGRTESGGANLTQIFYSNFYGRAYPTKATGADLRQVLFSYDLSTGAQLGELSIDCLRTRFEYDALGRATSVSAFDRDSVMVMHLDMETPDTLNAYGGSNLKDVSCAGTADSRNGQSVTLYGGPAETDGVQGKAREFDGGGQYAGVTSAATLEPTVLTVSAWIYPHTTSLTMDIVDKSYPDTTGSGYVLVGNSDGSIQFSVYDGDTTPPTAMSTGGVLRANTWQHVAGTFDGAFVRVYLDGVEKAATPFSGSISYDDLNRPLNVGANYGGTLRYFDGVIDEVQVLNVAMLPNALMTFTHKLLKRESIAHDDMTANPAWYEYQSSASTYYDAVSIPRKLYLDMETKRLNTVPGVFNEALEDLSGNGNHPTNNGAAPASGSSNCKIGGCYYFDGADYMEVATSRALNITRGITISSWVRVDTSGGSIQPILMKGTDDALGIQYYAGLQKIGFSWYLHVRLVDADGSLFNGVSVGAVSSTSPTHVAFTFDGVTVRFYINGAASGTETPSYLTFPLRTTAGPLWIGRDWGGPDYFKGHIDEVQVTDRALSATEVLNLYNGPGGEKSHVSLTRSDGLGRPVRSTRMDMFGGGLTSTATPSWNDNPSTTTMPSGQAWTTTYDFLGRSLTVRTAGSQAGIDGTMSTYFHDRARKVESFDAVGRKAYERTDLLGQTVETAVWNLATSAYGNLTKVAYNAIGKVTRQEDAKQRVTLVYYNLVGLPRFTIYPDGTTSSVAYDDNLRAVRHRDGMGREQSVSFDSLGRISRMVVSGTPASHAKFPTGTTTTTDNCGSPTDGGSWSLPDRAYSDDNSDTTATPAQNQNRCDEWNTFGFSIPTHAVISSVRVAVEYYVSTASSVAELHVGLQTDNGGTNCAVQEHTTEPTTRTTVTFDFTACKTWTAADLNGNVVRAEVGAHRGNSGTSVTFNMDYVKVEITVSGYASEYGYDASGNLGTIENGTGSIYRQFDSLHRMTAEWFSLPSSGTNMSVGYAYDPADRVTQITYQDGSYKAGYVYDSLSRLAEVKAGSTLNTQAILTYDTSGRLDYIRYYEDGATIDLYEDYAYDTRDRITEIRVYKGTTDYLKLTYVYDRASEITHIDDNANTGQGIKAHDYYYDGNGQLTRAIGPWASGEGSQTLLYTYDEVGNIVTKKVDALETAYGYGSWNRLNSFGSTVFTHNDAGSITFKDTSTNDVTYTYDYGQRLVKLTNSGNANTHTYEHDDLGRRLKTVDVVGGTTYTNYSVYSGGRLLGQKDVQAGNVHTFFVYLGERVLIRKTGTADNRYYIQDLSNNVRFVAYYTSSVQTEAKLRYKPFGEIVALTDSNAPILKFASQKQEIAAGLVHMGARYDEPAIGRFMSRDPIGSGYDYGYNNPISFYDPTGEIPILVVVAILVVVGAATAAASYAIPQIRPYVDAAMMVAGFVPFFGDILSTSYFLTQDAIDCGLGQCDAGNILLDLAGAYPGVPNLGGGARVAKGAFGIFGALGIVGRTGDDVADQVRRFERTFRDVDNFGDVLKQARSPAKNEVEHALAIMRASDELGSSAIKRFGGRAEPDIILKAVGGKSGASKWIEIKKGMGDLKERQLDRWLQNPDLGPGEVWFHGGGKIGKPRDPGLYFFGM